MLTSEIERLTEVLETGEETFGKTVQKQYDKRKEHKYASKNKKVKQIWDRVLFKPFNIFL